MTQSDQHRPDESNPYASPTADGDAPSAAPTVGRTAADPLAAPALGLLTIGAVDLVFQVLTLVVICGTAAVRAFEGRLVSLEDVFGVVGAVGWCMLGAVLTGLMLYGALKMRRLEHYGWARAAGILAIIPRGFPLSVCWGFWLFELSLGMWALVVLGRRSVKAAFRA